VAIERIGQFIVKGKSEISIGQFTIYQVKHADLSRNNHYKFSIIKITWDFSENKPKLSLF